MSCFQQTKKKRKQQRFFYRHSLLNSRVEVWQVQRASATVYRRKKQQQRNETNFKKIVAFGLDFGPNYLNALCMRSLKDKYMRCVASFA